MNESFNITVKKLFFLTWSRGYLELQVQACWVGKGPQVLGIWTAIALYASEK